MSIDVDIDWENKKWNTWVTQPVHGPLSFWKRLFERPEAVYIYVQETG